MATTEDSFEEDVNDIAASDEGMDQHEDEDIHATSLPQFDLSADAQHPKAYQKLPEDIAIPKRVTVLVNNEPGGGGTPQVASGE